MNSNNRGPDSVQYYTDRARTAFDVGCREEAVDDVALALESFGEEMLSQFSEEDYHDVAYVILAGNPTEEQMDKALVKLGEIAQRYEDAMLSGGMLGNIE